MENELNILLVEDNPADHELLRQVFERSGKKFSLRCVETREDYVIQLKARPPDVVISDYSLPQFNGREALGILKESGLNIPFILVTGSINEETAVECIKAGAQDYVLKHHLKRIISATDAAIKSVRSHMEKERAQEEKRKADESTKFLLEHAGVPILTIDMNGIIVAVNGTAMAYVRSGPGALIGRSFSELMPPEYAENALSRIKEAIRTGKGYDAEQKVNFMGVTRLFSSNVKPVTIEGRNTPCVLIVSRDITEKNKIDEALRESEDRYRKLVELSLDAITIHSEGKVVFVNNAAIKMMGAKKPEDLLGKSIAGLVHPDYVEMVSGRIKKMLTEKCAAPLVQEKFVGLDGVALDVEVSASYFMYRNKPSIQLVLRDISQRLKAETSMRASEERYRAVFNSARDIVFVLDSKGIVNALNPAFEMLCGWPPESWIGRELRAIVHPDDQQLVKDYVKRCFDGEIPPVCEARLLTKGKGCRLFEIKLTPLFKNAVVEGAQGIASDITERKYAEVLVRKSRDFYQKLFNQLPNPMWSTGKDGQHNFFNESWLRFRGRTTTEETGEGWMNGIHEDDRVEALAAYRAAFKDREQFCLQYRIKRFDGQYRWVLDYGSPYEDLNGNFGGYVGICHDITALKETEEALRSNYRVQTTINTLLSVSLEDTAIEEKMDKTIDILLTMPCIGLKGGGAIYLMEGKPPRFALKARRNFDEAVPAGRSASAIEAFLSREAARLKKMGFFDKNLNKKRNAAPGLRYCCVPVRSRDSVLGMIMLGLGEDEKCGMKSFEFLETVAQVIAGIIERHQSENEKKEYQAHLIQSSKLTALGELAAGVAHEINNPLTIIMGNAQYLLEKEDTEAELKKILAEMDEASQRCKKIISGLLGFSRQKTIRLHNCELNVIIDNVLHLCENEIKLGKVEIEKDYGTDIPGIRASCGQLEQVLINIIINAVQAMPGGGTLKIKTALSGDGNNVESSFTDTGTGIARENLSKLFEPFFTTKPKGTGLGLSVSYGLIKQHCGELKASSSGPGKGATFTISLPIKSAHNKFK